MTRTKTLAVIGCLVAAAVACNLLPAARHAGAQPPRARQKWEYATLFEFYTADPPCYRLVWRTGKKRVEVEAKAVAEGISKLNKALGVADLGGKDVQVPFGVLLDRIGQDGWELVTHSPSFPRWDNSQSWIFKRPAP
jgi:hypothetical protein